MSCWRKKGTAGSGRGGQEAKAKKKAGEEPLDPRRIYYDNDGILRHGTAPRDRESELRRVLRADNPADNNKEDVEWFVVESGWIKAWLAFAHYNKNSPAPGPIQNEVLLDLNDEGCWVPKAGLEPASASRPGSYRRVNGSVWRVYEELYPESGPAITVTGRPFDDVTRWKVHQQAPLARLQHLTKASADNKRPREAAAAGAAVSASEGVGGVVGGGGRSTPMALSISPRIIGAGAAAFRAVGGSSNNKAKTKAGKTEAARSLIAHPEEDSDEVVGITLTVLDDHKKPPSPSSCPPNASPGGAGDLIITTAGTSSTSMDTTLQQQPPSASQQPPSQQAPLVDVEDEDEVFISNERIVSPAPAPPLFGGVSDEAEAASFGPATAPSAAPATEPPAPPPPLAPITNPVVALLHQDSAAPPPPSPSLAPASAPPPPPPPPARLPSTGSAGKQSSRRGLTGEGKGGKTGASGFTFAGKSMDRARLL